MGKLILFNMMTIDGFFEGKNKEIDWHQVDSEFNNFAIEQLDSASTLVFGRITYQLMAGYWPTKKAEVDDPIVAERMNAISKVVFSKTLDRVEWPNTRLYSNNIENVIKALKTNSDKNIFIFGSANLASNVRPFGLIDEYRIMINPVLLGQGQELFRQKNQRLNFKLINCRAFSSGNVLLQYEPK